MRLFWSLMLVLFVSSMGVFVLSGAESSPAQKPRPADTDQIEGSAPTGGRAAQTPDSTGANEAGAVDGAEARESGTAESDAAPVSLNEAEASAIATGEVEVEGAAVDPFAAAAEAYLRRTQGTDSASAAEPVAGSSDSIAEREPAAEAPATDAATGPAQGQGTSSAPGTESVVRADGSLRIQEAVVVGDGTEARPYELNWPLLTGVGRVYKPEKGMKEVPEWLALLEGKRVRLTGHIVLPLVAVTSDELLLTMNPWDGCCVGVPPTPYDAMEVTLAKESSMQGASMYGTLEGTFRADPYIVGGWLLGLYLLDDARIVD